MKNILQILLLISMALTSNGYMTADAQNLPKPQAYLVLSSYNVPIGQKGAMIGEFKGTGSEKVLLTEDLSKLFEIVEGNKLSLKKGKEINDSSPMIFPITVKTSNGEIKEFDLIKDQFVKNKVIAHRGAWKNTKEAQNSIGSLKKAIAIGCEGSELDVWLTTDSVIVINHDNDLDGMIIEKSPSEKLLRVKLSNGESIPLLSDYVDVIKTQNKTKLIIEIKSNRNEKALRLVDKVIQLINEKKAQGWVNYISFDYKALLRLRQFDETANLAILEPAVHLDVLALDKITGIDYHYGEYDKMSRLVERCDKLGLQTNVWTVNTKDLMIKMLDLKVDYITTDEPEMLLQIVKDSH